MLSVLSSSLFCDNASKAQYDASRESGTRLFDNVPDWSEDIVQTSLWHGTDHIAVCTGVLSLMTFLDSASWSYQNLGHFSFPLREIKFRLTVGRHIFVFSGVFFQVFFYLDWG